MTKSAFHKIFEDKLISMIEPVMVNSGYDLIELNLVRRKSSTLLKIIVDNIGGITLDQCAELSRQIAYLLEVEDPIDNRYTLEVSSPGLDRPLTTFDDFRRKVGETVQLTIKGESNCQTTGTIVKADNGNVTLRTDNGEEMFALADIACGKIIF